MEYSGSNCLPYCFHSRCNLYNPPNSSNVLKSFDIDIYDQLEAGIIKYNALGKVFVSGDFNSRTSDSIDYILYDKYIDHKLQFFDPTPLRKSQDQTTDYDGFFLKLLDMCLLTGLLIANGRLHDDKNVGNYIFCSQNGMLNHQGWFTALYTLHLLDSQSFEFEICI